MVGEVYVGGEESGEWILGAERKTAGRYVWKVERKKEDGCTNGEACGET